LILQRIKDYGKIRWAVKAQELIPKGTFIDQYFGEVVTAREAMKRAMEYSEVRGNVMLGVSGYCSDTLLTLCSLHGLGGRSTGIGHVCGNQGRSSVICHRCCYAWKCHKVLQT